MSTHRPFLFAMAALAVLGVFAVAVIAVATRSGDSGAARDGLGAGAAAGVVSPELAGPAVPPTPEPYPGGAAAAPVATRPLPPDVVYPPQAAGVAIIPVPAEPEERTETIVEFRDSRKAALIQSLNRRALAAALARRSSATPAGARRSAPAQR